MVCEKDPASDHDFESDPIRLAVDADGAWLRAAGTTLGADNGLGVAAALAALDLPPAAPHPPLEALFTVAEEVGLIGAAALDARMLSGRTLLNLDSEDWGTVYIGCAGAGESNLALDVSLEAAPSVGGGYVARTLALSGLAGGHSGLQIDAGLGNAVQLLAGALAAALEAAPGARLVALRGGDKRNAIPRDASADLLLPAGAELAAAEAAVAARLGALRAVYGGVEPSLALALDEPAADAAPPAAAVVTPAGARALVDLLLALPHGPARMSAAMPGLVETSSNLASVRPAASGTGGSGSSGTASYEVVVSSRSSIPSALAAERARVAAVARLAGAKVEQPADYPGWAPDPHSPVLALCKQAVAEANGGQEPHVTAIHAGLECGVLGGVLGGQVDMVSFGPTILGAHSPAERVEVATVAPFWAATRGLLARLAQRR